MNILTIILAILFAVDNIAIWLLIDTALYLLKQDKITRIVTDQLIGRVMEND